MKTFTCWLCGSGKPHKQAVAGGEGANSSMICKTCNTVYMAIYRAQSMQPTILSERIAKLERSIKLHKVVRDNQGMTTREVFDLYEAAI